MKDLTDLAARQRVVGNQGLRTPASIWRVKVGPPARRDGDRLFKQLPKEAKLIAIDQARNLALFPDSQPVVNGELLDLDFEKVQGEIFYRLRIDDASFGDRSLRVFFYPQKANGGTQATCVGTIWIVGLSWRPDAYKLHMLARCRRRVKEIIGQGR